jgi:hypothetical protein
MISKAGHNFRDLGDYESKIFRVITPHNWETTQDFGGTYHFIHLEDGNILWLCFRYHKMQITI